MDKEVGSNMWYKGIIIEIKEKYSIVLKDDSSLIRIKNREGIKVGDVIIFLEDDIYISESKKNIRTKFIAPIIAIAASLSLIILPFIKNQTLNAYALISLDINPSIQFELDEYKNIIDIYGLNEDSKKLMLGKVKGMSLDDGIKEIKVLLENENYNLKNNDAIVGFSFLTNDTSNKFENEVKNIIKQNLNDLNIIYIQANKENAVRANEKGISIGRYEINEDIDEDLEDKIEHMSVDEILEYLEPKNGKHLNEEVLEELEDELEDRQEDLSGDDNDDEDNEDDDGDEDDEDDDDDDDDD